MMTGQTGRVSGNPARDVKTYGHPRAATGLISKPKTYDSLRAAPEGTREDFVYVTRESVKTYGDMMANRGMILGLYSATILLFAIVGIWLSQLPVVQ